MPAERSHGHTVTLEVRGHPAAIAANGESLRQHLEDLLADMDAAQRGTLEKARVTIKPLPVLPVEQLKRDLLDAYEGTMLAMNHDLGDLLDRIARGDDLADLDDHPLAEQAAEA